MFGVTYSWILEKIKTIQHELIFLQFKIMIVTFFFESTKVSSKLRAIVEFLTAEKFTPFEIQPRLKAIYGDHAVDRSAVIRRIIKCRDCKSENAIDVAGETRSGRSITQTINIRNSSTI